MQEYMVSYACKIAKSGWQYILQYYIQLEMRLPELKSLNIIRRHVNIAINKYRNSWSLSVYDIRSSEEVAMDTPRFVTATNMQRNFTGGVLCLNKTLKSIC